MKWFCFYRLQMRGLNTEKRRSLRWRTTANICGQITYILPKNKNILLNNAKALLKNTNILLKNTNLLRKNAHKRKHVAQRSEHLAEKMQTSWLKNTSLH